MYDILVMLLSILRKATEIKLWPKSKKSKKAILVTGLGGL
jgi:hypothetical protein